MKQRTFLRRASALALILVLLAQVFTAAALAQDEALSAFVADGTLSPIISLKGALHLEGRLYASAPISKIEFEIFNRRMLTTDKTVEVSFAPDSMVTEYDLSDISAKLIDASVKAGEKRLRITVSNGYESAVAFERDFYVRGACKEIADITAECQIVPKHGSKALLTDNNYKTYCSMSAERHTITITIPENRAAGLLTLSWYAAPTAFRVDIMNREGALISQIKETNPSGMLTFAYDLDPAAGKIVVCTSDEKCGGVSELRVLAQEQITDLVQRWQPVEGKVDLMVISAHQDDELLFFGGTIPYYAAEGKNVAVVYMANCSRARYAEAMEGLWACGLKNHPIFLGLKDKYISSYSETKELWGADKTERKLVELIRRYQPDVIVTHDVKGEYGHNQHKLTSALVQSAVKHAGNPAVFPESAKKYGTWDVKKLYIHLYAENPIYMDIYNAPMEVFDGMTATEIATIGYDKHVSQVANGTHSMETDGYKYDNHLYGLAYSTVGLDVLKTDFFENISD